MHVQLFYTTLQRYTQDIQLFNKRTKLTDRTI